jgi:hypothetical protein
MDIQEYLQELETALRQRLEVIADHSFRDRDPEAHRQALREAAGRLQHLQANFPPKLDPHLAHYLQNASYQKALHRVQEMRAA